MVQDEQMRGPLRNWAGNITFGAAQVSRPGSVAELQQLVAASPRVRALGTGHSFSDIADTGGVLVSVAGLPRVLELDRDRAQVTVSAGLRYGELASWLHERGWALANLGSLPHISVAGACATGTHGSGDGNRCLATAVAGAELVTAGGDLVQARRDDPGPAGQDFAGIPVSLGTLGVLTRVTLDLVPAFTVRQWVYDGMGREGGWHGLAAHLDEIFARGYSVSLFTQWAPDGLSQAWVKELAAPGEQAPAPDRWLGGTLATGPRHPVPGLDPAPCTEQLGRPGPWHLRLPHFRLEFTPSAGDELQSEYLVPREHAGAALAALSEVAHLVAPVLQISELRTVAADGLWLSPAYQRPSLALHFTWIPDARAVAPAVTAVQEALAPLRARPHWGKVFSTPPGVVAGLYPRLPAFRRLRGHYDPGGKFGNGFTGRYLGADS
jgi:alditol oxidase